VKHKKTPAVRADPGYESVLAEVVDLVAAARRASARTVNAIMTTTYWSIGCRIVEQEQRGAARAGYGEELVERLSRDLSTRFGRGFGRRNLFQMRAFYLAYRRIPQAPPAQSRVLPGAEKVQTASALFTPESAAAVGRSFPLPWSHYVRLLSVRNPEARRFYETEALRGGWSIRQLDRQIDSQFYERTALSRNKVAMLRRGEKRQPEDAVIPEEEIKDPYVLVLRDRGRGGAHREAWDVPARTRWRLHVRRAAAAPATTSSSSTGGSGASWSST
jgi:hypothetical protein